MLQYIPVGFHRLPGVIIEAVKFVCGENLVLLVAHLIRFPVVFFRPQIFFPEQIGELRQRLGVLHLIPIAKALEDAGKEVQQFPGQEMGHRIPAALFECFAQNPAQEHHAERRGVPKGPLVLHVGGELIERLFDGRQITHLFQHRKMLREVRSPAVCGGEPVPRDICDLEMGNVDSIFFCHVAASLSCCLPAVLLLQSGVPPFQHGFQAGFPASICKNKELLHQSGE